MHLLSLVPPNPFNKKQIEEIKRREQRDLCLNLSFSTYQLCDFCKVLNLFHACSSHLLNEDRKYNSQIIFKYQQKIPYGNAQQGLKYNILAVNNVYWEKVALVMQSFVTYFFIFYIYMCSPEFLLSTMSLKPHKFCCYNISIFFKNKIIHKCFICYYNVSVFIVFIVYLFLHEN